MSDLLRSWLRTVIPTAWGSLITWLVSVNLLPADLADQARNFSTVLVAVAFAGITALWYLLWRWLEPHVPAWLRRIVLGSANSPTYIPERTA